MFILVNRRLTLLDYVFVDEHNRHKRLKGTSRSQEVVVHQYMLIMNSDARM